MKKNILKLLFVFSLLILPFNAFAAGGISTSTSSLSITEGSSKTFTINATNAAGKISIATSNPSVATISISGARWIEDENVTVTVTGKSAGNATITVTILDAATFDEEVISGTRTVNVVVNAKPSSGGNSGGGSSSGSKPATPDTRSKNSNLSKLLINGTEVTKKDGNYVLDVSNFIDKVEISATAEDSKATVSGTGSKNVNVGANNFDVVVKAENGSSTTYKVIINRSEYNLLSDLEELLEKDGDLNIKLSDDDSITSDILNKIINSKKTISLNKIDEDGLILYSWILDGKELEATDSFNPFVATVIENNDDMEEAFNYAGGVYFDLSNCGEIPEGAILKYYVGKTYDNGDSVNLYIYDEKTGTITKLASDVVIKDGYVELDVDKTVKHFISKTEVSDAVVVSEGTNIWFIVSIVLIVVVLLLFILLLTKKNKKKDTVEETVVETPVVEQAVEVVQVDSTPVEDVKVEQPAVTDVPKLDATVETPVENTKVEQQEVVATEQPVIEEVVSTASTSDVPEITSTIEVVSDTNVTTDENEVL